MDFIEHLPISEGFTAILVVVDCFTKQSIFIPTYDTITSTQLAELFIVHVFSKHGVPSHVNPFRYNIPENQALPIYYIDWDPDLTAGQPLFIILTENQGVAA